MRPFSNTAMPAIPATTVKPNRKRTLDEPDATAGAQKRPRSQTTTQATPNRYPRPGGSTGNDVDQVQAARNKVGSTLFKLTTQDTRVVRPARDWYPR
jgi:hypothetical protein